MNVLNQWRQPARRASAWLLAASAALALLAGCGGGSSQVQTFVPERVFLLGDENSMIVDVDGNADGYRYTVNDRATTTTTGQCNLQPIFVQRLLLAWGYVVAECNPAGATVKAFTLAREAARLEDATDGMQAQISAVPGGLNENDLVSVMLGVNDIIAVYEQVVAGQLTDAQAIAEATRLGGVAAGFINQILATGSRAIVITLPDMSVSPWALAHQASISNAQSVIQDMIYNFNARMRTTIDANRFDGRNYGLVLADDIVAAIAKNPTSYLDSPASATVAACTTSSVLACTTTTLVDGASITSHLWADDRHLSARAHLYIGQSALSRATGNPF